jgi:hypothetical protein
MSLTKLSLGGNNDVTSKLFPPRESLVSDIPAGDGNIKKLFYGVQSSAPLQPLLLGEIPLRLSALNLHNIQSILLLVLVMYIVHFLIGIEFSWLLFSRLCIA